MAPAWVLRRPNRDDAGEPSRVLQELASKGAIVVALRQKGFGFGVYLDLRFWDCPKP